MEITNINFFECENLENLKAWCSVCFEDVLVVKDFKVVEGKNGLFAAFPTAKGVDGNYYDKVYALNADTREYINDTIIEAYYKFKEEQEKEKKKPSYKGKRK